MGAQARRAGADCDGADQTGLGRRRPGRGHGGREARVRNRLHERRRQGGHRCLPRQAPARVQGLLVEERGADAPARVPSEAPELARLAELIRGARSVVALTGAGVSVPSGIPDFRSPGTGLWERVNPMEVAHIDVFRADPERFWRFYGERFATLEGKRPNAAHTALVRMER